MVKLYSIIYKNDWVMAQLLFTQKNSRNTKKTLNTKQNATVINLDATHTS